MENPDLEMKWESNDDAIISNNTTKLQYYIETVEKKALDKVERFPQKLSVWLDPNTGELFGLKRDGDEGKKSEGLVNINIPISMAMRNAIFRRTLILPTSVILFQAGVKERAQDILQSSITRLSK